MLANESVQESRLPQLSRGASDSHHVVRAPLPTGSINSPLSPMAAQAVWLRPCQPERGRRIRLGPGRLAASLLTRTWPANPPNGPTAARFCDSVRHVQRVRGHAEAAARTRGKGNYHGIWVGPCSGQYAICCRARQAASTHLRSRPRQGERSGAARVGRAPSSPHTLREYCAARDEMTLPH